LKSHIWSLRTEYKTTLDSNETNQQLLNNEYKSNNPRDV
jgi:hypothetical protein